MSIFNKDNKKAKIKDETNPGCKKTQISKNAKFGLRRMKKMGNSEKKAKNIRSLLSKRGAPTPKDSEGISSENAVPVSNVCKKRNARYFGTDGFRGRTNQDLTPRHAFLVGRYLGFEIFRDKSGGRCVIGKDTRLGGEMLVCSVAAGLAASGVDVFRLGVITTPGVSYITQSEGFDCGIMISASHNPYYDNGIKLFSASGDKVGDDLIFRIEDYIDSAIRGDDPLPYTKAEETGRIVDYPEGADKYKAMLRRSFRQSLSGMKVALDMANGATVGIGDTVFEAMGAEVYLVGCEPNGMNINKGVGSTAPERLAELVRRVGADAGFAFDGDGDRCIAVDSDGRILDGDYILYILARWLKECSRLEKNKIVATVSSNSALKTALGRLGVEVEYTDVGDRFVSERMRECALVLGGERSGHIIIREHSESGDGIITALCLASIMKTAGKPISQLAVGFEPFPETSENIEINDRDKIMGDPCIKKALNEIKAEVGEDGKILVRKSGTEPVIRISVEHRSKEKLEKYMARIKDIITKEQRND